MINIGTSLLSCPRLLLKRQEKVDFLQKCWIALCYSPWGWGGGVVSIELNILQNQLNTAECLSAPIWKLLLNLCFCRRWVMHLCNVYYYYYYYYNDDDDNNNKNKNKHQQLVTLLIKNSRLRQAIKITLGHNLCCWYLPLT